MDLKQLDYFRHVAELGSFTRASSFLSVVQPALSRQIRQLEVELGQDLFERNGRGVVLTEAGVRLLEHARGILNQVGRARQELEDQRKGDTGHFALGLPPSLGASITVPLVKAFANALPNANLVTVEGFSAYMLEWLDVGRVDCALVYSSAAPPNIEFQPLLIDQLFLISPLASHGAAVRGAKGMRKGPGLAAARRPAAAPARVSISLNELAEYPLIMPSRPHAMRMAVESALAEVNQKISIAHEIESVPAIIDLVRQGHGYGVLPKNAVGATQWAAQVRMMPVLEPTLTIPLSIATSSRRARSPLMRKSMDLVRDVVRQEIVTRHTA